VKIKLEIALSSRIDASREKKKKKKKKKKNKKKQDFEAWQLRRDQFVVLHARNRRSHQFQA